MVRAEVEMMGELEVSVGRMLRISFCLSFSLSFLFSEKFLIWTRDPSLLIDLELFVTREEIRSLSQLTSKRMRVDITRFGGGGDPALHPPYQTEALADPRDEVSPV